MNNIMYFGIFSENYGDEYTLYLIFFVHFVMPKTLISIYSLI